jgi:hypothetical protein
MIEKPTTPLRRNEVAFFVPPGGVCPKCRGRIEARIWARDFRCVNAACRWPFSPGAPRLTDARPVEPWPELVR